MLRTWAQASRNVKLRCALWSSNAFGSRPSNTKSFIPSLHRQNIGRAFMTYNFNPSKHVSVRANRETRNLAFPSKVVLGQQVRTYIFLPKSFQELQLDLKLWLTDRREKRTILVKLLRDRYRDTKTRIRRRTRTIKLSPPSRNTMSIKYRRWGTRLRNMLVKRVTIKEYSRDNWFDADGYPLTSRDEAGRFVNPWSSESTSGSHPIFEFLSWRLQRLFKAPVLPSDSHVETVPVDFNIQDPNAMRFTWIAHSTCVLQLSGYTILTDPHFSQRAAPLQLPIPFNGVERQLQPACDMDDLPFIDVCLLTHDHYDHLDRNSCFALKSKIGRWIVPLGIKEWLMEKCEVQEHLIEELQWWQSTQLVDDTGRPPLSVTCAPTQHWSCRTMWDRNQRLWCSFVVDSQDKRFFFGGDTGFPEPFPLFSQIGQRLGPFDLAALPIGAYSPRFFMADSHCNPSEAVKIHQQIRATKSIAIHWATFRLAEESDDEPPLLLKAAADEAAADFSTLKLGESIEVRGSRKQNYL